MTSLVKQLDEQLAKRKELKAFVVVLTEDEDATTKSLKELAKNEGIKKVPLTLFQGKAGPETYKIAKDADVTVHFWVKGKVKVNHAFRAGELTDNGVQAILADLEKFPPPDVEKKEKSTTNE